MDGSPTSIFPGTGQMPMVKGQSAGQDWSAPPCTTTSDSAQTPSPQMPGLPRFAVDTMAIAGFRASFASASVTDASDRAGSPPRNVTVSKSSKSSFSSSNSICRREACGYKREVGHTLLPSTGRCSGHRHSSVLGGCGGRVYLLLHGSSQRFASDLCTPIIRKRRVCGACILMHQSRRDNFLQTAKSPSRMYDGWRINDQSSLIQQRSQA